MNNDKKNTRIQKLTSTDVKDVIMEAEDQFEQSDLDENENIDTPLLQ